MVDDPTGGTRSRASRGGLRTHQFRSCGSTALLRPGVDANLRRPAGHTMMLSQATPATIRETWLGRASTISGRPTISEVAEAAVSGVYDAFTESLVLARAFLTVPYGILPERHRSFASAMAHSVGLAELLQAPTPVHCILATRGHVADWNDPMRSRDHVAIPLLSDEFVASIPMIACLLKALGLPLTWLGDSASTADLRIIGSEVGSFLVADPVHAVDEQGRRIIPDRPFVDQHSVRSVFAVGGVVFGGSVLTLIFFSTEPLASRNARAFMPLVSHVKGLLLSRCSVARTFSPAEYAASEGGPATRCGRGAT